MQAPLMTASHIAALKRLAATLGTPHGQWEVRVTPDEVRLVWVGETAQEGEVMVGAVLAGLRGAGLTSPTGFGMSYHAPTEGHFWFSWRPFLPLTGPSR